jgi:hypothetical protein
VPLPATLLCVPSRTEESEDRAMSYGHADKIAGRAGGDPAPGAEKPVPAIDLALYRREDVRRILAALDIGALYRILQDAGVSQR